MNLSKGLRNGMAVHSIQCPPPSKGEYLLPTCMVDSFEI